MRIAIIGAGINGLMSAYYLQKQGHSVSVFEKHAGVASECSAANGAQLAYSFSDAFAQADTYRGLPGWLLGQDDAVRMRVLTQPALWFWGLRLLYESRYAEKYNLELLKMALESSQLMQSVCDDIQPEFSFRRAGKLVIQTAKQGMLAAEKNVARKQALGFDVRLLSAEEVYQIEPATRTLNLPLLGALYSVQDEIGDCYAFCQSLYRFLLDRDVKFGFGSEVKLCKQATGVEVAFANQQQAFDAVIVCSGTGSVSLLKEVGVRLPLYPVTGYSVTLPTGLITLNASITIPDKRIVLGRLGKQIRIAGFADFLGLRNHQVDKRVAKLLSVAKTVAPELADYSVDDVKAWFGHRPMMPDSLPRVGATKLQGLYLNTGHGMLGWVLAAATAKQLSSVI